MLTNYHTHTTMCDGVNTPEEVARAAFQKGFAVLGFSGHLDHAVHVDWPSYCAKIRALRDEYAGRMDILLGTELDQRWPRSDAPDTEYVIGSTHFIPLQDGSFGCVDWSIEVSRRLCHEYFGGDWYRMTAAYFETEAEVWEKTHCDIIGHFDLVARFNHEYPCFDEADPRYLRPAVDAMEALVKTDAVFEINCGAFNRDRRKDFYPARPLLRRLRELNAPVCLSSDAHDVTRLDGGFAEARLALLDCGFTEVTIWRHDESGGVVRETDKL